MQTRLDCSKAEQINQDRRRFLGAALAAVTSQFATTGAAEVRSGKRKLEQGPTPSFGALKQIDAGVLNLGYAEAGPAQGPPVLLLHGWPYDIHRYVEVAP